MSELTAIVPDKGIRGCYNGTGGTIAKGTLVALTTTANHKRYQIAKCGDGARALGVAMEDISNLTYGDVQVDGVAIALSGGAITRGLVVSSDTNGKVVTGASGDIVVGQAVTITSGGDELFELELTPGGNVVP